MVLLITFRPFASTMLIQVSSFALNSINVEPVVKGAPIDGCAVADSAFNDKAPEDGPIALTLVVNCKLFDGKTFAGAGAVVDAEVDIGKALVNSAEATLLAFNSFAELGDKLGSVMILGGAASNSSLSAAGSAGCGNCSIVSVGSVG